MLSSATSWRFALLLPFVLLAAAVGQPPTKDKTAPPAKGKATPGKEEEDPNAKAPRKPIRVDDDVPAPEGRAPEAAPGVLVVAVRELPTLMSPAFARTDSETMALDLIFEGLLRPAADSGAGQHYEPALARELPGLVPLGRSFTLSDDAAWADPDGADLGPVTAADVRTSLAKLHARTGRPGAELGEQIDTVFVDGQKRCRLVFKRGQLDPLAPATFKVLPSRPEDEAFARRPVGSGPFVYAGRETTESGRQYAVFKKNPLYGRRDVRRNRPHLVEVRLLASRDPVTDFRNRAAHLVLTHSTGEAARLNTAQRSETDPPAAKLEVNVAGLARVLTLPSRRIYYLAVNHRDPYLGGEAGKLVRQVLAYSIRRDTILTDCYRAGYAEHHQPLNGPFPPNTWPCSPRVGRLDVPALATGIRDSREYRALGLEKKSKPPEFELKYPAGDPAVDQACKLIVQHVAEMKAGFTVKPVAVPADRLWRHVEFETNYHLAFRHYDYPDDWFSPAGLLDTAANGLGGRNFLGYKPSDSFGPLLAKCQDRRDFGELRQAMHRLHDDFRTELPFIPLWHLDTHVLVSDRLETRPEPRHLDPLAPFAHADQWRLK